MLVVVFYLHRVQCMCPCSPKKYVLDLHEDPCFVQVPLQLLRSILQAPLLARCWREQTPKAFWSSYWALTPVALV